MKQHLLYTLTVLFILFLFSPVAVGQRYVDIRTGSFYIAGEVDRQVRIFNNLNANIAFQLKPYLNAKIDAGYGMFKSVANKSVSTSLLTDPVYEDYRLLNFWYPAFKFRYVYTEGSIEFMPLNFILGHTDPLIEASTSLGLGLSHHTTYLNLEDDAGMPYDLPERVKKADELYDNSYETKLGKDQGFSTFLSLHAAVKIRLDYKIDLSLEAIGHLHKTDYLDGLSFEPDDNDMVILFLAGLEFEF